MIDYETFCRIKHLHEQDRLSVMQIAQSLALDPRTVQTWLETERYRPRQGVRRSSKLDRYKATVRLVERHPYSAVQIFQRLRRRDTAGRPLNPNMGYKATDPNRGRHGQRASP